MRSVVGEAPHDVLALAIRALERAATEPDERPPHEEVLILQFIDEDAANALPSMIALLKSKSKVIEDDTFYMPLIVAITKAGPSSSEAMNAVAAEWTTATPEEWKGPTGQTLGVLVHETARYGELARPLGSKFVELLSTENKSAAIWGAWALVITGHDPARGFEELLLHVASGTTENRSQAATALAALGSRSLPLVAQLKAFENDPDSMVAKQVREALQRIAKDDRILTHAEVAARNAAARKAAKEAIAAIGVQKITEEVDSESAELIRKMSDPDQAVRDQAAAQLKTLFKPSPKQPWQETIDGIPEGASRAEVFAKLGIDEKDLFVAIDSQEHYRLDDTWMVHILFAGDPGKVRTLELVEQLNRPFVAPPENFTGTWVIYYVNGVKANEIGLRDGKYHGLKRSYHANGRVHVQQHYTNQGAESEDTVYYDSGQLMYRGRFENSKPIGTWIYYSEDGSEESRVEHSLQTKLLADAQAASLISLQVVDAKTSQPIAGAEVVVRQTISTSQPQAKEGKLNLSNAIPESRLHVKSDASGRVEFIIPATMRDWQSDLQISVRHPDYVIEQSFGSWQVTAEMAEPPAQIQEMLFPKGVVSLKPGFEVSGQILSPDGTPAQGVNLYAASQMPEYLNMPPHAVTDAEGRYKFRVSGFEDTYLFIIPSDAVALSIPIQEQYGEHPVVKLEAGTVITGRVLDEDGKPLANIVVQGNRNDTVYTGFPNPMVCVATDADGRYKLPPQTLPVDVRVARFGYLGGWSPSGNTVEGAYLPVLTRVGDLIRYYAPDYRPSPETQPPTVTLDFRPVETVTLTARAYYENGNPTNDEIIELFGVVPGVHAPADQRVPRWRGMFRSVPGQVGVYQLKAPKGLLNATIDLTQSGTNDSQNNWTRAVRDGENLEGSRTNAS